MLPATAATKPAAIKPRTILCGIAGAPLPTPTSWPWVRVCPLPDSPQLHCLFHDAQSRQGVQELKNSMVCALSQAWGPLKPALAYSHLRLCFLTPRAVLSCRPTPALAGTWGKCSQTPLIPPPQVAMSCVRADAGPQPYIWSVDS